VKNATLSALLMALVAVGLAWAGTKIQSQDLAADLTVTSSVTINSLQILGVRTNVQIQGLTCAAGAGRCLVSSSDEGDLYISFGAGLGQFRNSRTGKLP